MYPYFTYYQIFLRCFKVYKIIQSSGITINDIVNDYKVMLIPILNFYIFNIIHQ